MENFKNEPMTPIFCEYFGDTPRLKTIDYLITGRAFDYSISDIARGADIGRTQAYATIQELQTEGIVIPTRKHGTSQFYQFNTRSMGRKPQFLLDTYLRLLDLIKNSGDKRKNKEWLEQREKNIKTGSNKKQED